MVNYYNFHQNTECLGRRPAGWPIRAKWNFFFLLHFCFPQFLCHFFFPPLNLFHFYHYSRTLHSLPLPFQSTFSLLVRILIRRGSCPNQMEGIPIQISNISIYTQWRDNSPSGWHGGGACWAIKIQIDTAIALPTQHFCLMFHLLLLKLDPLLMMLLKEMMVVGPWCLLSKLKRVFLIWVHPQWWVSQCKGTLKFILNPRWNFRNFQSIEELSLN